MNSWRILLSTVLLALTASGAFAQGTGPITMQVVKYDALKEAILQHRGKVVIVDFWQIFCAPCIANMQHLVEMQKKGYEKQGLVIISVNIDAPDDDGTEPVLAKQKLHKAALAKLQKHQFNFQNLLLDENTEVWQKHLRFLAPPCVYVFDRQGRWTQFASDSDPIDVHKVEDLVVRLLKEK